MSGSGVATSRTRSSGPVRRSKGTAVSARSRASSSASEAAVAVRTGTSTVGWTTWVPCPSTVAKVVRSASCRATRPATAAPSAAWSTVPVSRSVPLTWYSVAPGAKSSRNHRRSCAKESGSRPSRGTGSMGCAGPSSGAAALARSTASARSASRGASKRSRTARWAPRPVRTRLMTRVASSEWPPSAKKSSSAPTRSTPSTSAQTAASAVCVPGAGATYAADSDHTGVGRARRSSLPLAVAGSASRATKAAGTM